MDLLSRSWEDNVTMLQCYNVTFSSLPKASAPHFHLPPTHHGKDKWAGMGSTSSSDQEAISRTGFRYSALSAMEAMPLLSLRITLLGEHWLLTPSRLLLPQELIVSHYPISPLHPQILYSLSTFPIKELPYASFLCFKKNPPKKSSLLVAL